MCVRQAVELKFRWRSVFRGITLKRQCVDEMGGGHKSAYIWCSCAYRRIYGVAVLTDVICSNEGRLKAIMNDTVELLVAGREITTV